MRQKGVLGKQFPFFPAGRVGGGEPGFGWSGDSAPFGAEPGGGTGKELGWEAMGVRFQMLSWERDYCVVFVTYSLLMGRREHPQTEGKSEETEGPRLWLR